MASQVDISGMVLFVKIVEHGSLSAAGRALSMPKATVSRELQAVESRLGATLLHRSTRALSLTDFGRRYYERVAPIVLEAEQAQAEAMAEHSEPTGLIRISAPVAFGQHVLAPCLFDFLNLYKKVRLDLQLTDEVINIIAGGVDLAIRIGQLQDSGLISRQIRKIERVLVASPSYIKTYGVPKTPEELVSHKIISTRPEINRWVLGGVEVKFTWRFSTGSMTLTKDAAVAGMGIAFMPTFLADECINKHELVQVLADWPMPPVELHALYPKTSSSAVAVRRLIEHISNFSEKRTD